jgi:4-hydroxy-tetrahydrodipicolinate synthase
LRPELSRQFRPEGVIAAIPTPFDEHDEIDESALRQLIDFLVKNGIHGIMTTGGNGEFPHLLSEERKRILEIVVEHVAGRVPVIACTSSCGTKETIMLSEHAKRSGADAIIIVPPYYFKLSEDSILDHFREIASAVDLPIVVYNNPEYTGNNISPNLMARLADIPGIVGLKQSNYDISQTLEIIRLVGDRIAVLTGIDSQLLPVMSIGGCGIFSTAACVIPREMVAIYEAVKQGDIAKASEIQRQIQILNRFFEYDPGYVAPCKEALEMLGLRVGRVRMPLPSLTEMQRSELQKALRQLGLL